MTLRVAKLADLEQVVAVALVAMPSDPQWNYRFPHRHEYWEDHEKYTTDLFRRLIDPHCGEWLVMVVEAESSGAADAGVAKIVAFAVWDVSFFTKRIRGANHQQQKRS
jgi:hypothetical protein